MGVRRIAEPDVEPVTVDEAKDHLNFDSDDKDTLIAAYISAARAHIENWCHIVVAESEWELTYDEFPDGAIAIPKAPLIEITSVKYDDADGDEQTIDAEDYYVDAAQNFGWVVPVGDWPTPLDAVNAVRVRFTAGWPNDSNVSTAPPAIRQAVLLLVGSFFDNREAVGSGTLAALPLGVEALISTYRVPVLA